LIWVKKIENVGQILSTIFLDYRVQPWRDPRVTLKPYSGKKFGEWTTTTKSAFSPATITGALWEEFHEWRIALPANTLLIRYGCDRHFNKLTKELRPNKVRVIQRRAYGLRDEEYLRLKILTCMLPAL
jgi:hypothetical protein